MPKRRLHISDFQALASPTVDPGDLSSSQAEYAENVALKDMPGALKGRRGDDELGSYSNAHGIDVSEDSRFLFIRREELGGSNEGYEIRNLDTNSNVASLSAQSRDPRVVIADYRSCRVGQLEEVGTGHELPEWVGQIDHGQFQQSAPSGTWNRAKATLEGPLLGGGGAVDLQSIGAVGSVDETNENRSFQSPKRLFYAVSLIYDGYQEGPLIAQKDFGLYAGSNGDWWKRVDSTWRIKSGQLNPRVTDVCIYALLLPTQNRVSDLTESYAAGDYQLVQQIPIGSDWTNTSEWTDQGGGTWDYNLKDKHGWSTTYAKRTGVTQALSNMSVKYTLATNIEGTTLYSGAAVPGMTNAASHVFPAKAGRPDMIDWSKDGLKLELSPVALESYKNTILAFGDSRTALIRGLVRLKERTSTDVVARGCLGRNAVAVGNEGVFWAGPENIHFYDGQSIQTVGDAILESRTGAIKGWRDLPKDEVTCLWVPRQDAYLVLVEDANDPRGWSFSFGNATTGERGTRWSAFEVEQYTTRMTDSVYVNGRSFLVVQGKILEVAQSGASRKGWTWTSKEIGGQQPGPERVFYYLDVVGDAVTVEYREDRGTWQTATTPPSSSPAPSPSGRHRYKVNSASSPPWHGVTRFQFRLTGEPSTEVRSVSLITRSRSQTS